MRILTAALVTIWALASEPIGPSPDVGGTRVGATWLEGRLLAPCCWQQTLDVHPGPLADSLRAEIVSRVDHGESVAVIENDLASRYGERIRAVPQGPDPRARMPYLFAALLLGGAGFVLIGVHRWTRRRVPTANIARIDEATAGLDRRLDEELEHGDDV